MSERKSLIRRFFGAIWSLVELIRRIVVVLFLVIFIGVVFVVLRGGPPIVVEKDIALVIAPWGEVVDYLDEDPRAEVTQFLVGEGPTQTRLSDLLDAIDAAANDSRIRILFLKLDTGFIAGQAQLEELAAGVTRFRESGKKVFAYAPNMGQPEYYLAAHADEIFVDPLGMVFLPGYESYQLYFREALEKIGVAVNVFRVGEFKAAVEPFLRTDMSEAARGNAQSWLEPLWANWLSDVARARGMDVAALEDYVNDYADRLVEAGGDTAQLALDSGLVDGVLSLDALRERAGMEVGMDPDHGSFRQIDHARYLRALDSAPPLMARAAPKNSVGVVVLQGQIVEGFSEPGLAGGDTVSDLLRIGRDDPNVAAIVLRVESPGGSVYASEQIRRAVLSIQNAGKPVIVSMASVAASGGYWVAMDADRIYAHASTITGSIGVFGLVPTFRESLEKLGVSSDGVGTTVWGGAFSSARDLSTDTRRVLQVMVEKDYERFISRVAAGRELSRERVEELAGGRIWAGVDAVKVGLVDQLGDLDAAIDAAAAQANLLPDTWSIYPIEPAPDIRTTLLRRLSGTSIRVPQSSASWLAEMLGQARQVLRRWNDTRGSYAHCLCAPNAGRNPASR